MFFDTIAESDDVVSYISARQLTKQYRKAKQNLLHLTSSKLDFKERKPKGSGIYSFRINKQYRALAVVKSRVLVVYAIDNHQ